jgi:hypothetical protein
MARALGPMTACLPRPKAASRWRGPRGNRATETANGVVDSYFLTAGTNRLSNVSRNAAATRIFSYDAAGNVIQDLRGANAYNYAVNNAGRIKWVTGARTASYLYDGFQKLRYRAQGGAITKPCLGRVRPYHCRAIRQRFVDPASPIPKRPCIGTPSEAYLWVSKVHCRNFLQPG